MPEPFSLTQLRELPSNLIAGQPYATVNVPAYTLLALIDTAKATISRSNDEGWCLLCEQLPDDHRSDCPLARYTTE